MSAGLLAGLRRENHLAAGASVGQVLVCLAGIGHGEHLVDDQLDLAFGNHGEHLGHGPFVVQAACGRTAHAESDESPVAMADQWFRE